MAAFCFDGKAKIETFYNNLALAATNGNGEWRDSADQLNEIVSKNRKLQLSAATAAALIFLFYFV